MTERLTIAVPKGALYDETAGRLRDAGIDVPAKTGRKDAEVLAEFLDTAAGWMAKL